MANSNPLLISHLKTRKQMRKEIGHNKPMSLLRPYPETMR